MNGFMAGSRSRILDGGKEGVWVGPSSALSAGPWPSRGGGRSGEYIATKLYFFVFWIHPYGPKLHMSSQPCRPAWTLLSMKRKNTPSLFYGKLNYPVDRISPSDAKPLLPARICCLPRVTARSLVCNVVLSHNTTEQHLLITQLWTRWHV